MITSWKRRRLLIWSLEDELEPLSGIEPLTY